MRTANGTAHVRCRTSESGSVLSYRGADLSWLGPGYDGLKSVTTIGYVSGREVPGRITYMRENEPWVDAVIFPGKLSQLEIAFELDSEEVLADRAQFPALLQWIEFVAQNFVGLYSAVTGEVDVSQPRMDDLDETRILTTEKYDLGGGWINAEFDTVRLHAPPPGHAALKFFKDEIDRPRLEQFANYVNTGYVLAPSQRLILRAKEQAQIFHNYDLSILVVGTAFEVGVREILTSACESRQVKVLSRRRGRGKKAPTERRNYRDAIEKGDLKSDLLDYVAQLGGDNGRGGSAYSAWVEHSYNTRNAIVHQGKQGFGDGDADKAFTSAVAYLEFLRRQFA
jgi:hypothetical protein